MNLAERTMGSPWPRMMALGVRRRQCKTGVDEEDMGRWAAAAMMRMSQVMVGWTRRRR